MRGLRGVVAGCCFLAGIISYVVFAADVGRWVILEWDPNPPEEAVIRYRVWHGAAPRTYDQQVVTEQTSTRVEFVGEGAHYFAVTAENQAGLQSDYSNEVFVGPLPSEVAVLALGGEGFGGYTVERQGGGILVLSPVNEAWGVALNRGYPDRPLYDPAAWPTKKEIGRATIGTGCAAAVADSAPNWRYVFVAGVRGVSYCSPK